MALLLGAHIGHSDVLGWQWRQRVPKTLHSGLVQRARQEGVCLNSLVTAMIAEGLGVRQERKRGGRQ